MLQYAISVLFLVIYVASVDSFLFPDETPSNSRTSTGYDEDYDYDNSDSYDYHSLSHDLVYNDGYNGNGHRNVHDFSPTFSSQQGLQNPYRRPRNCRPVGCQSQANAQASGSSSTVNSQSGSRHFNDFFSQSYAHADSHDDYSPYNSRPSGPNGPLEGSSAASATSGVVNGLPVASASAASASSSGSATSASSSSGFSGGFENRPSRLAPWFFQTRITNGESDAKSNDDPTSVNVKDDKIIFGKYSVVSLLSESS